MDITIFSLSVLALLFQRKIEWPIIGMIVLANNYLGIGDFFENNGLNYYSPQDLALVLMLLILIVSVVRFKPSKKSYEVRRLNKYIVFFFVYLLLTIIIDLFINGIGLWSVLRTSRHWLMMLMFVPLMRIPKENLERTLKLLYKLTLIISAVIVFEYITGINYFTEKASQSYVGSISVTRGVLPSTYALLYVLLVAMGYGKHKKITRYAILALLTFSLLLSATKSIALGLFIGFVILTFLKSRSFITAIGRVMVVTILAFSVVMILPNLRNRLIYGYETFGNIDDGSSTFRLLLTEERFNYIVKDPVTLLFGIGNVTEDNFKGNFQVGLINSEGERAQLDTGDIAWALLLLRLGVLGTLFWIGLTLMFVWCFMRRRGDPLSILVISYLLLNLLVLSFAGTNMYRGAFWTIPLICLNIVYPKEGIKDESGSY